MNKHSLICKYIATHRETWKEDFHKMGILCKEEETYAIFNYSLIITENSDTQIKETVKVDFHNPIVQEARGIIIDFATLEVVCWPFRKFGNWQESYADEIDWESAKVQEKMDGSIIKLWYDRKKESWRFSTNGMITPTEEFSSLLQKLVPDISFFQSVCDKEITYIFELISPKNQIVVRYPKTEFYHIGSRNNITGQEYCLDIGIKKPKEYSLHSLKECIHFAEGINKNSDTVEHEGFVVVDKNFHRIKIKSPEYLYWHHKLSNHVFTKEDALKMIIETPEQKEEFLSHFPEWKSQYLYYEWQFSELQDRISELIEYGRTLYEEFGNDRGAVARMIKGNPDNYFIFAGLGNECTLKEILAKVRITKLAEKIPDYPINKKEKEIVKDSEIEFE